MKWRQVQEFFGDVNKISVVINFGVIYDVKELAYHVPRALPWAVNQKTWWEEDVKIWIKFTNWITDSGPETQPNITDAGPEDRPNLPDLQDL